MRGLKDPRMGTKCSLEDPDFSVRNYLWLLSSNRIYLIDTHVSEIKFIFFGKI
jgi:hypothetical protein